MILSMTGYGSDIYSDDKFSIETEIKSLNSRFLDLSVKLPKELSPYEFEIRDLLKGRLKRGKISVNINLTLNSSNNNLFDLNERALKDIVTNLEKIRVNLNLSGEVSIDHLLSLKDYFISESNLEIGIDWEKLRISILKAIDALLAMRGKEGKQLKSDIVLRINLVNKLLTEIEEISKNSTKEYFEKFKEKTRRLYEEYKDDENRFLIELGILSEKHDVTEECIRLRSHIQLFYDALGNGIDIGRKLNFICQEMNREVNTINSKSISSEISHLGISIKEELEKIREQVQNIE